MNRVDSSLSTLEDIKKIMNRSTVFLTLSGWSGILAGTICLIASGIAYQWIYGGEPVDKAALLSAQSLVEIYQVPIVRNLSLLALCTFLLVLVAVFVNTRSKVVREKQALWDPAALKMAASLFIPIITGAIFILGLAEHHALQLAVPASLVFYGLGLVSTSRFTFTDIRYVGFIDLALGILAMFLPQYNLLAWAIGFGLLHIIYGFLMFNKASR